MNIKTLLPRTMWTTYRQEDKRWFCIWRMWFGRCYDIKRIQVSG